MTNLALAIITERVVACISDFGYHRAGNSPASIKF